MEASVVMFEGVRGDFMLPQEWSFAVVFKGQAAILERSSLLPLSTKEIPVHTSLNVYKITLG